MHEMDMTMTDLDDKTQSNPPPFKIKFWDVFGGIYVSAYIIVFAFTLHNRNYKTEFFITYYDALFYYISFLNINYKFAIVILSFVFYIFIFYFIIRRTNYIKIYQPEMYYKYNYDQNYMKSRVKKIRKFILIMMIVIPLIVNFI